MANKILILFVAFIVVLGGAKASLKTDIANSVKTLAGINCLVETAFNVENAANDFSYDIEVCNADVADEISTILDNAAAITEITGKIIDVNDGICGNAAYNESTDADTIPPKRCSNLIKTHFDNLKNAVTTAQDSLSNLSKIEDSCSRTAASSFKSQLSIFAGSVKECSSL